MTATEATGAAPRRGRARIPRATARVSVAIMERLQPTLPGVEESVMETRTGSDVVADPKSVPSADELATQLELGVAPAAPNNDVTNPEGLTRPAAITPKPAVRHSDAPMCMQCGVQMVRAGSCHACPSCGNPDLKPEKQTTYEIGTEMRFLNSAITLEAAYYNTLCTNQIAQGYRASYATGSVLNTQNAASLRNEGIELTLGLVPYKRKDFDWSINFNFSHVWSKVLTLPASIGPLNDFYNSDTYISNVRGGLIRGYSTGTLTGSTYQRNNAGQILISPSTGLPLINAGTNSLIGDRTPDFTLGTLNTFRYKNWNLSFLWDLKVGGDIYNGTDQLLTYLGKSARTADRARPIVITGVLSDGLQNTNNPTVNTLTIIPQYNSAYYSSTNLPDEEFIQKDVNWLRLRDITLSYSLTPKTLKPLKFVKGLSVFLTGSDLILITNYYGADPAVNANNPGTGGVGGYGMDLGSAPTPIGISFGLRARF